LPAGCANGVMPRGEAGTVLVLACGGPAANTAANADSKPDGCIPTVGKASAPAQSAP
jgi:hypothetical protein